MGESYKTTHGLCKIKLNKPMLGEGGPCFCEYVMDGVLLSSSLGGGGSAVTPPPTHHPNESFDASVPSGSSSCD